MGGWHSRIYAWYSRIYGGGPCDFGVTLVPIGLGFGFETALGFGLDLGGLDLGLGLDSSTKVACVPYTVCILNYKRLCPSVSESRQAIS